MSIRIDTDTVPPRDALVALYDAVGWTIYISDPARLERAVRQSRWLATAWDGPRLVGLCRAVGDGETICYLQDVLVHPDAQRQGVGRALVEACLEAHQDIRQFLLVTDDRPEQLAFYRSVGLSALPDIASGKLNCFIRFN